MVCYPWSKSGTLFALSINMTAQEENTMKCKFLLDDYTLICHAGQLAYLPTDFQREEYCIKIEHRKCPLYLAGSLPEHDVSKTEACNDREH